ncbi:MAG: hypothetical protein IJ548_03235 [Paludibacteraceae bacterium]|nr:hypothetical protein [Paludibacteraceae bacterium]MBQ9672592.1 hypothetical protein [Prevotella sp.]
MTAIELKYSLFKDIDSINDESVLRHVKDFVKSLLFVPQTGLSETAEQDVEEEADEIDYNFGGVDFGYPRTLEEVEAALEQAEAERNDPTKWVTSQEFHQRLEQKYPWLR